MPFNVDLDTIIGHRMSQEGPLLPLLQDVQAAFGCVDAEAERAIADALNISRAEVHGVVSFYHDFTPSRDGRPEVQICRAEACRSRGIDELLPVALAAAGDRVKLSNIYCLGLCSVGPNARIGDLVFARLTQDDIVQLIDAL